jgi:hypothetical protein
MKPKILLRIAATLMFLHTMGHTLGALSWKNAPNAAVAQVVNVMLANHFNFMGHSVSMGSFYDGYGFTMILVLLLVSTMLWVLSSQTNNNLAVRFTRLLGVFLLMMGVLEYIYFFPFAAAFSLLAGICTVWALFVRAPVE